MTKLGDSILEHGNQILRRHFRVDHFAELTNTLIDFIRWELAMIGGEDFGMHCWQRVLLVKIQFFIQLFAGTNAREFDFDGICADVHREDPTAP